MIVAYVVTCMSALIYVPDTGWKSTFTFKANTYKLEWISDQAFKVFIKNRYSLHLPISQCSVAVMYEQGDSEK